jgi:uncharacterized membrane protein
MREFRFFLRERRRKKRVFACPVCHLELSLDDLDNDGYTVCPLCGAVLEVVLSGGFPLPVVHDLEIKRVQPRFRTHSLSTHISIGLLPIAFLFSVVAFVMGFFLFESYAQVEKLGLGLFILSLIGSTITFGTGFLDWRRRYRGRPYAIIYTKIKLSIVFWIVGIVALIIRLGLVNIGTLLSPTYILFIVLQLLMLVIIAIVGHIGGNLVFGK